MKLALFALVAFTLSGCTKSLNVHRETFEPTERKGAWSQYERDVANGKDPADPTKRALFRERE